MCVLLYNNDTCMSFFPRSEFSRVVGENGKRIGMKPTYTYTNPSLCCACILVFETFDWVCVCEPSKCLSICLVYTIRKVQHSKRAHIFHMRCNGKKMQFIRVICMDLQIILCPMRTNSLVHHLLLMDLRWRFRRYFSASALSIWFVCPSLMGFI